MSSPSLEEYSGLESGQVLQRNRNGEARLKLAGKLRHGAGSVELCVVAQKGAGAGANARSETLLATSVTLRGGRFRCTLKQLPTGGPYELRLKHQGKILEQRKFWVGDVWLLAGQSNMEGMGDRVRPLSGHRQVRVRSMEGRWRQAQDPLHVLRASPHVVHNEGHPFAAEEILAFRKETPKGVGPGLSFALARRAQTGVPQGLIPCAHGGTTMKEWKPTRERSGKSLFGAMLSDVDATGQGIAGVLWYQGESDATPEAARVYSQRMKTLVSVMREEFGAPRLPIHLCQLGRVAQIGGGEHWESLREQQRRLPEKIEGLTLSSTIDLSLDDHIHISGEDQQRLGKRLAWAAATPEHLPHVVSVKLEKRTDLGVSAAHVLTIELGGVRLPLGPEQRPEGFVIRDPDGVELPLTYHAITKDEFVHLFLTQPPPPGATLHYGAGVNPLANVTDSRDLALPAFGPRILSTPLKLSEFLTHYEVSQPLELSGDFAEIELPRRLPQLTSGQTDGGGFVNLHEQWKFSSGRVWFRATLHVPQKCRVHFLAGYDGPFKLWVGNRLALSDPQGTNPAFADQVRVSLPLPAGRHVVTILMDVNDGAAWGFLLRAGVESKSENVKLPKWS